MDDPAEYIRFTRRVVRAAGQRAADADPELLEDLVALAREVDAATIRAIRSWRQSGATWDEIGQATGTSRQAAWEKWAKITSG